MDKRILLLPLLFLTACSSSPDISVQRCPQVAIVRSLSTVEDHGRDSYVPETLVATAHMETIKGACTYSETGVDIHFDLSLKAKKGPRLGHLKASFPFFISMVQPDGDILKKEIMTANFTFEDGKKISTLDEALHVFIPADGPLQDLAGYRVLSGFQMTEEQYKASRR